MPSTSLPGDLTRIALTLCEGATTEVAERVSRLISTNSWDELVSIELDPRKYSSAIAYHRDAVAVNFLRKLEDLPTTFDRAQKALDNFWIAEKQCYRTNERLGPYLHRDLSDPEGKRILSILDKTREILASILGPCPDLVRGKFGPGATFADRGKFTTIPDKMSSEPTVTGDAYPFLFQWAGTAWASACASSSKRVTFVRGNRFTTVPKDCKKHRGIAVEPSINLFYQLGYGGVIRDRLKHAGIELVTAQDTHRRVACEASIKGHMSTLDLSNASDTVASTLVELLLPSQWHEALASLRSPYSLVKGKWVKLEKFSSMGNGYTFELETLIFLAISMTCLHFAGIAPKPGENVFVYGDDIIVPTEVSSMVVGLLNFLGFTLNKEKSFVSGPFRESCGGDFFLGEDVRPYFLKELPYEPQQHIALANGIRRLGGETRHFGLRNPHYLRAWFRVLDALPSHIRRLRGPRALGDLVVYDDDQSRWQLRRRHSIRYIGVYRPARFRKVSYDLFRGEVVLACAVYGCDSGTRGVRPSENGVNSPSNGGIAPRDAVLGYKVGWVPFS